MGIPRRPHNSSADIDPLSNKGLGFRVWVGGRIRGDLWGYRPSQEGFFSREPEVGKKGPVLGISRKLPGT